LVKWVLRSAFEKQLRGEWGGQQVEVDGAGRLRVWVKKQKAGQNVHLTLDLDLQKAAEGVG